MIYKLCFNQQIHRCPKTPENFKALNQAVIDTFKTTLPKLYTLSYVDQDGDQVLITDQDDFQSMLETFGKDVKSVKIFVEAKEPNDVAEDKSFATSILDEMPKETKNPELEYSKIVEEEKKSEPVSLVIEKTLAEIEKPQTKENDRIDLSDKKLLKEFILQTLEEAMPAMISKYLANQEKLKKESEKTSVVDGIAGVVDKITNKIEKIVIGEKLALDSKIQKYGNIIPELITTDSKQIYANILIKNSGMEAFPANAFLQNVGGVYGDIVKVSALDSQKEFKTTLILNGPKKAGNYVSKWRLGYVDERNVTKYFGEEFELKFNVVQLKYPSRVEMKAQKLKEIFSEADWHMLCEFVNENPSKTIEVLAEEFSLNAFSN